MKPILLCLHGWGGSKESFAELRKALEGAGVQILAPDLPGFGNEPDPPHAWTVDDYADWIEQWIATHGTKESPLLLLGHSHGGRIAIKLATRSSPFATRLSHLYLCASAGIRHPRHIKRIIGLMLAKTGKTLLAVPGLRALEPLGKRFLYRLVRVHDYEQASPVMRETLVRVSTEDLRPLLSSVAIPTDIFWGTDDRMTPYDDALIMQKEIRGSVLHTFPGTRHAVHRTNAGDIAAVIREQLHAI